MNKENLVNGSKIYYALDVIEEIETAAICSALEKTEQSYAVVGVVI